MSRGTCYTAYDIVWGSDMARPERVFLLDLLHGMLIAYFHADAGGGPNGKKPALWIVDPDRHCHSPDQRAIFQIRSLCAASKVNA